MNEFDHGRPVGLRFLGMSLAHCVEQLLQPRRICPLGPHWLGWRGTTRAIPAKPYMFHCKCSIRLHVGNRWIHREIACFGCVLADAEFDSERNHTFIRQQLHALSIIPAKRGKRPGPLWRSCPNARGLSAKEILSPCAH
jgi:hypothetical protein